MVFVTGPLCSGKRTFAQKLGGRQVYDVQDLAVDAADLNRLADELADYDVVTAAEVGGGVVAFAISSILVALVLPSAL